MLEDLIGDLAGCSVFGDWSHLTSVAPTRFHPHALEILVCTAAAERLGAVALEMRSPARDARQQARWLDAHLARCGLRVVHVGAAVDIDGAIGLTSGSQDCEQAATI